MFDIDKYVYWRYIPFMERIKTPTLVAQAAEKQRKLKEIKRVKEQTPIVAQHITDIIRATVPDPSLDREGFYIGSDVKVMFPFVDKEETVNVTIETSRYPLDKPYSNQTFRVYVEGERFMLVIGESSTMSTSSSSTREGVSSLGFDQKSLDELNDLLNGIDQGVKEGSIKPIVINPHPITKPLAKIFAEDSHIAPLG